MRPELAAEIRRGIQSAASTELFEDVWSSQGLQLRSDRLVSDAARTRRATVVDVGFEREEKSSSPFLFSIFLSSIFSTQRRKAKVTHKAPLAAQPAVVWKSEQT